MFVLCFNKKNYLKGIQQHNQINTNIKIDTKFMNSGNSKISKSHVLILMLTVKLVSKRNDKSIPLSNLTIYYTWKNIKSSYNNNKFKISAPTWNNKFELPDWSYSISDIQEYSEYIFKKINSNDKSNG